FLSYVLLNLSLCILPCAQANFLLFYFINQAIQFFLLCRRFRPLLQADFEIKGHIHPPEKEKSVAISR
ncbi:hypothetical protein RZN32_30365, partial [Klebsiella pneumoniae]|nr:hypothetical protein [Klebsiella pneumoniae]